MSNWLATPSRSTTDLNTASALGLRQMFPRHTNSTRCLLEAAWPLMRAANLRVPLPKQGADKELATEAMPRNTGR